MAVAVQGTRHVDALATGMHPHGGEALHLTTEELVDLDGAIEARIRRAGHDHATDLLVTPLYPSVRASSP